MMNHDPSLKLNEFLIAEFGYLAQAAQQANEDRARVTQYYFMALGSMGASLFGLREFRDIPEQYLRLTFVGLALVFSMLTVFGHFTARQLISLRLSWLKSLLAMDMIKEYYIDNFSKAGLSSVIRFRADELPPAYKPNSLSHLLALATFFMSALSLVVAAGFLEQAIFGCMNYGVITVGFFVALLLFYWEQRNYRNALENSPIQADIDGEAKKIQQKNK
jgi:hypothetical protein